MKKLRKWLEIWFSGGEVREIKNVPLYIRHEILDIYNAIIRKEKPSFISLKTKEILDKCEISTISEGIGWKIA